MRSTTMSQRLAVGIVAASLILTACGDSSNTDSTDSTALQGASDEAPADVAAAEAAIAPYIGQPSAFPIDTPLAKKPTGKRIAFMDCGTPVCGLFFTLASPAADALGMDLTRIKTGLAADSVAAAFDTVVQDKYDGVFVPAIPPSLWQAGLDKLEAAEIPVVTSGVTGGDSSKIDVSQIADENITRSAELLASYVVAEHAADTNVVFYYTPELAFSNVMEKAFSAHVTKLCADCTVRTAKIPVASFGTRAPSLVTDDLQANPNTCTAVFAVGEQALGLPAALKTAGLSIQTIAAFPDPGTLEQIKSGQMAAALGIDLPVIAWTAVDSLARLTTGEPAAEGALADRAPQQFLTSEDLTGDVSKGWLAYPDFADRFMKLWSAAA
jgi:ribose transport system substrate-binding protein